MGAVTANLAFPYPFNSDTFDPPSDIQALAEAIDAYLAAAGILHMQKREKPANESITSDSSLNTDADLSGMTLLANTRYRVEGYFDVESNPTADFKLGVLLPASATFRARLLSVAGSTDDTIQALRGWTEGGPIGVPCLSGTGGLSNRMDFVGHIVVAATAGTLTVQWSQNVSDAGTTTVKAGAHVILTKLTG